MKTDSLNFSSANKFSILDMDYFNSLANETNFIEGITKETRINFMDANIVTLEENVFRPLVEVRRQGDGWISVGRTTWTEPWAGRNPLVCDFSIYWIIKDPNILAVFDRPEFPSYR